jgi:hypothetical protein
MEAEKTVTPTQLTLNEQLTGTLQDFAFACSLVKSDSDKVVAKKMLTTAIRSMKAMIEIL